MQANEVLGNFELALTDCEAVLNLDPKNKEAIQAKQRLSNRIAGKGNHLQNVFTFFTKISRQSC